MKTKAKNPTSPLLALAKATLAERKNEPIRLAAAVKKAANRQGFHQPKRSELIAQVTTDLGKLTRELQVSLAGILKQHGAELVQDRFFPDYLLGLQTGYLHQLVSACTLADYILRGRTILTTNDPRFDRLHNLEWTLRCLLSRRPAPQPVMAKRAA